jgi:hypothetical protein
MLGTRDFIHSIILLESSYFPRFFLNSKRFPRLDCSNCPACQSSRWHHILLDVTFHEVEQPFLSNLPSVPGDKPLIQLATVCCWWA